MKNRDSLNEFINNVDGNDLIKNEFDPNATRNFKQVTMVVNEYEYDLLKKASKLESVASTVFIRESTIKRAKEIVENDVFLN